MLKKCNRCNEAKPHTEFPITSGRLYFLCKNCKREYDREYWAKTSNKRRQQKKKNNKKNRDRNKQFLWDYLQDHPCIDCGESDPVVLEFDHKRDKLMDVSRIASWCLSIDRILEEIEKCEVRCANCHRRKTAEEQGWYIQITGS